MSHKHFKLNMVKVQIFSITVSSLTGNIIYANLFQGEVHNHRCVTKGQKYLNFYVC